MNCQTSKESISQFIDGELPHESLQPLFQHLGDCEECRNFFVQAKSVHDEIKKLKYVAAPNELDEKFGVLGMEREMHPLLSRRFTVSFPSAILSGFIICLMSLVFFVFMSKTYTSVQYSEYQSNMNLLFQNNIQ